MDRDAASWRDRDASPRDRLLALRAGVDGLVPALADARSWPQDERRSALRAVDALVAAASAARAHLLLAERDADGWRATGAASFARWRGAAAGAGTTRAGSVGSGAGAAAREERQAEALVRLPAVGAAVQAGVLGLDHASVIGAVAADRSATVRAAVSSPDGQAELVELARSQDAPAFARAVRRWADAHDGDALQDAHEAQRRARFLHLGTTDQGTRISGRLDAVAGHRLRLALVTLAENALTEPGTAPGAAVRPHVSLLVREETWRRHRRHRSGGEPEGARDAAAEEATAPRTADEPCPGAAAGGAPGPATWEDGTPLPPSEVGQVLCDCDLTRIVLDADDVPLNVGRTRRTYTGAQRRAVIARDRGCRWPGCGAQARWCEIHHIRWWGRDGGETSVVNGVLLCSFHHHEVHRRDLTVSRVAAPVREVRDRRRDRSRPGGARAGAVPADVDAHDPGGGAGYRFVTGDGRVVAGPGWVVAPEVPAREVPARADAPARSVPGAAASGASASGVSAPDASAPGVPAPGTSAPGASASGGSTSDGPTSRGASPGVRSPGRVGRTRHTGPGRPSSRHHQDALEGIPP